MTDRNGEGHRGRGEVGVNGGDHRLELVLVMRVVGDLGRDNHLICGHRRLGVVALDEAAGRLEQAAVGVGHVCPLALPAAASTRRRLPPSQLLAGYSFDLGSTSQVCLHGLLGVVRFKLAQRFTHPLPSAPRPAQEGGSSSPLAAP